MTKRDEIVKLTKISNKNFIDIMNNLKWKVKSADMTWKDNHDISSIYKIKDVQSLPLVTFIGTDCELSIDIEKFTLIGNGGNFVFFFKDNINGDCLTIGFEDDDDGDALINRLANAGYIKE